VDLIIRRTTLAGSERPQDIGVAGDRIVLIAPALPDRAPVEVDAERGLVTPTLVEPHLHLDAVLAEGEPRHNRSGEA
jgi:cytosine/creatinine deaminase